MLLMVTSRTFSFASFQEELFPFADYFIIFE